MNLEILRDKPFTVLLISQTDSGQDDWAVFSGIARLKRGVLYLDRGPGNSLFEVRSEWVDRIQPVDAEIRDTLLGAEYYLPLVALDLPANPSISGLVDTGFKWPK